MMPQIVKAPIISYGEYIAGLPATFAERFKAWESAFTGDYRSPGSSIFGAKGSSSSGLGGRGGGFGSDSKNKDKVYKMMQHHRIRYYAPADYTDGSDLDTVVKQIIQKTAAYEALEQQYVRNKHEAESHR